MKTRFLGAAVALVYALAVSRCHADVVTRYSFEDNLLDTAAAGTSADNLSAIIVGGAGVESYETGVVGQAVRLDVAVGSSFALSAPTSADVNLAADFTLEAYVKPDLQNSGEWDRFWTKWGEGSNDWHWAFRYANNGSDFFMNGGQVFDGGAGPTNSVPLDQWSHVAIVGDSTGDAIRGYLNGSEVVSATYSAPILGVSNMNFGNFAHGGASNALQFTGLIDEAMIHNTAVSDAYLEGRAALLPVLPPETGVAPPPTTGLISYYTFDDTINDVANGFGQNVGTVGDHLSARGGAVAYVSGQVGSALRIGVEPEDLTDLNAPVSADVNLPATYTIEAWINPSDLEGPWQRLVLNWGAEQGYHFAIRDIDGADTVSLFHNQMDGAQPNADGGDVVEGEWQHVAAVADGTRLNVYLNGELVSQAAYDGTISVTATEGLGVGDSDTALSDIKYNGLIDDLAIWAVPLSDEQIRFQYRQGLNGLGATVPEPGSIGLIMVGAFVAFAARRNFIQRSVLLDAEFEGLSASPQDCPLFTRQMADFGESEENPVRNDVETNGTTVALA